MSNNNKITTDFKKTTVNSNNNIFKLGWIGSSSIV